METRENFDYYSELANRVLTGGMTAEELPRFASYKEGESWEDFVDACRVAKRRAIGGAAESLFDGTASEISKVVEIDTGIPLWEYRRRLVAKLPSE